MSAIRPHVPLGTLRAFLDTFLAPVRHRFGRLGPKISPLPLLSYFDFYYNLDGEKTLREYSRLIDLRRYERIHWRTSTDAMETLAQVLDRTPHTALLTPEQERALTPVDRRTFDAGLLGADWAGLYKPGGEKG